MYKNIAFLGGIHGVGKSYFCLPLSKKVQIAYLSASEVLNWKALSNNPDEKLVENIAFTQDKLIRGLQTLVDKNKTYLLDGHFSLFNGEGMITPVPVETFRQINPAFLIIMLADPQKIAIRLKDRDGKTYDSEKLSLMQNEEARHAHKIAETLNIECHEINDQSLVYLEHLLLNFKKSYESFT